MLSNSTTVSFSMMTRAKAFFELLKFRLSFLVAFSGAIGYLLASGRAINWNSLVFFALGGFLVTGSANIINQIIETDLDKLMSRTMNRPLPTGKISSVEATLFSFLLGGVGLYLLLIYTNIPTTLLTLMSSILYGFVYTPLKRKGPIAVFVGAIPGALPPLIGWCAAAGNITYEALLIFGIQFIWQFPHFWAIAWVLDDDYKKAGFNLFIMLNSFRIISLHGRYDWKNLSNNYNIVWCFVFNAKHLFNEKMFKRGCYAVNVWIICLFTSSANCFSV